MSDSSAQGVVDRFLKRFSQWNLRFWPTMIGTSIVLVAVGLFFAQKVKLDSDLKSLLPKRAQSVVSLEKIDQKAGGTRDFKVVLWGGEF